MPGTTDVSTEAGVFASMRRGEIVADSEEHMTIGFSRDKVVADVGEFSTSPEVLCKTERRVFVLGHRREEGWESGESMTHLICTS